MVNHTKQPNNPPGLLLITLLRALPSGLYEREDKEKAESQGGGGGGGGFKWGQWGVDWGGRALHQSTIQLNLNRFVTDCATLNSWALTPQRMFKLN